MKKYIFTDLACEAGEYKGAGEEIYLSDNIKKTAIDLSESDARLISKNEGRYVTFFTPKLWMLGDEDFDLLQKSISREILDLIYRNAGRISDITVLAVGLGNVEITPDSLGPQTVRRVSISPPGLRRAGRAEVDVRSVIPGVAGNTGIETADIIRACAECVSADALLVVDALSSRSCERLASTVQISDSGISPGRGVGAGRAQLDMKTLHIPVISLGVPTVVNSSTMMCELLEQSGIVDVPPSLYAKLHNGLDFFVTPKEIDLIIRSSSLLLSSAINSAFAKGAE